MIFDESIEKLRLSRLDEAIKEFYGYTFESMFNIDYQTFLRTFDVSQRDEILAGNLYIDFDKKSGEYILSKSTQYEINKSESNLSTKNEKENTTQISSKDLSQKSVPCFEELE